MVKLEEFSRVGGATAVDFVNTRPLENGIECEKIGSFANLVSWAKAFGIVEPGHDGLLPANSAEIEAAHRQALDLRNLLRTSFEAVADGGQVPVELVLALNAALRHRRGSLRLEEYQQRLRLNLISPIERPEELVGAIAQSIADFLATQDLTRLKQCGGPKCVLWFLDTTRNHSRQWCRMDRCGARQKSASYYRRHKKTGLDGAA